MAYDMAVDSQKLDRDLGAIADAIRSKTGSSEPMTLDQMPEAIAGIQTGGGQSRTYKITLNKTSGWVLLVELDADVFAHIYDDSLVVSMANVGQYEYAYYSSGMFVVSNAKQGQQGELPLYGMIIRETSATNTALGRCYHPANNTVDESSPGEMVTLRLDGTKYYVRAGDGFIKGGEYLLTFSW